MIERDPRHRRGVRPVEDVGRVEPAAQTDLDQSGVGRNAREGQQSQRRRHLERCDRPIVGRLLRLVDQRHQRIVVDQPPRQADAFVEPHQMRRGIDVAAIAGGLQKGAQKGDGRALAVGAGDMEDRRQAAFRMAQRG